MYVLIKEFDLVTTGIILFFIINQIGVFSLLQAAK